jgi:hypothetical protein
LTSKSLARPSRCGRRSQPDKRVIVAISLYLYGPQAAEVLTREEPLWRDWLEQTFLPVPS